MEGFDFKLTAVDGDLLGGEQPDRVRIKIWEMETGLVVYDKKAGADDSAELDTDGTVIQGGSVLVHKK